MVGQCEVHGDYVVEDGGMTALGMEGDYKLRQRRRHEQMPRRSGERKETNLSSIASYECPATATGRQSSELRPEKGEATHRGHASAAKFPEVSPLVCDSIRRL